MPKPTERVQMSSLIPRGLSRKLGRFLERHLSARIMDRLNRFWIQTRLLFSRSILVMFLALFVWFSYITMEMLTKEQRSGGVTLTQEEVIYPLLFLQCGVLAILLHMALWETEREKRTFESLIMRVPDAYSLIWFKLRVSFLWTFFLTLPFFLGLTWFASIPVARAALYFFFILTTSVCVALLTCVVSSFVHRGLPTGILTAIITFIFFGISEGWQELWYRDYYRPFLNPFDKAFDVMTLYEHAKIIILNRVSVMLFALMLYKWFRNRLQRTEKWVL